MRKAKVEFEEAHEAERVTKESMKKIEVEKKRTKEEKM
jgi:hypothetical protein